jgi:regulator of RNase E activity RraA
MTTERATVPAELDILRGIGTSTLATILGERGYPAQFLAGLHNHGGRDTFVGYAHTMRLIPARADLADEPGVDRFRFALDEVPEDHVVVVDSMRDGRGACFGEMLVRRLVERHAAGVVTDGAIRDSAQIRKLDIAVAAGSVNASSRSPYFSLAGIGEPIACGGVAVVPGDVLVGDDDGVVVVPIALAGELAAAAHDKEAFEEYVALRLGQGAPLRTTYPPNDETRRSYREWVSQGRPVPSKAIRE